VWLKGVEGVGLIVAGAVFWAEPGGNDPGMNRQNSQDIRDNQQGDSSQVEARRLEEVKPVVDGDAGSNRSIYQARVEGEERRRDERRDRRTKRRGRRRTKRPRQKTEKECYVIGLREET
jgi:hypothetical protein